ncbi:ammonium transporter [Colwellia sp. RE-S-Sl-9]
MDYSWLLTTAFLVFLMQAGFLCLESGKIRSKNSINVAAKNISDFIVAVTVYWTIGFALMFGESFYGLFGTSEFFFGDDQTPFQISFFIFQMMFCGTAATLLSGAVAERMTYRGYIYGTLILSAIIYPICGHWAWSSIYSDNNQGWLESLGFVDFAGATVVHSVGGSVALAAVLIIGPRLGRFNPKRKFPQGSNLPIAVLGVLLIWLGWFGFNGGSTLALNEQVPSIILNTCISAVFGGIFASMIHNYHHKFIDVSYILNGVISGLVAITACCNSVSAKEAMLIGIIAGVVLYYGTYVIEKLKIDDALGVIPVHLFAGIWGTLAVALFSDLTVLDTGLSRFEQFNAQLIGIFSIFSFSFIVSFILFKIIDHFVPLRVSAKNEMIGMNISEHRASTELIDLLDSMRLQQTEGEFSASVPEEPFTEVGQIAKQYNKVIKRVNNEITQRDNAIDQFRSSEKRKSAILDSSMDSIVTVDLHGNILEFNPASEKIFGYLKRSVIGKNFIELFIQEDEQEAIKESLKHQFSTAQGLLHNRRNTITLNSQASGEFPAEVSVTRTNLGSVFKNEFTLHIRNISRQLKLQNKLKQLAYSDSLTGLYNRTYLMNCLESFIKKPVNDTQHIILFFLDLDRFKQVNDTLGHKAGDILLCEVASRLIEVTRSSDIIARWGGDEFIVMMEGELSSLDAINKAQEILSVLRSPIELEGHMVNILTSIGIALSKVVKANAQELIKQADMAMYHAKKNGRNNFQLFQPDMEHVDIINFTYEQDMRSAINDPEQFHFVYQPKVNERDHVIGFEALARWLHSDGNYISPSIFIPIAENSEAIITIGELAIKNVLEQQMQWSQQGLNIVPISVNISGKHLISGQLIPFIKAQLSKNNISGEFLEIEITEGVLLTEVEECINVLSQLKEMDIKISVDDFGTGYSSLSYLKRLPIDILKIDRSFVNECASTTEDGQICSTIINLANNLSLSTIAEGVETEEQKAFLLKNGCSNFQGYLFSKPITVEQATPLLRLKDITF